MGTTSTSLTVTIITRVPGEADLLLEADIVASDNDGETTYYTGNSYILRLFKSPTVSTLIIGNNIGTVSKASSGLTASVPYEGEDDEYIVFTGGDTANLSKMFQSHFTYTPVGSIYDENGQVTSASLTPPLSGTKSVLSSKKIYGVYKVTYITKYDTYTFNSGVVGPMLIFFIGSDT
jgi:hypothetical protein